MGSTEVAVAMKAKVFTQFLLENLKGTDHSEEQLIKVILHK